MSTSYETIGKTVTVKKLHDDIIHNKIEGISVAEGNEQDYSLTDGANYVWCSGTASISFTRYGLNDPSYILDRIAKYYKVKIVSEHGGTFPIKKGG